jgi:DNA polymerase elongation subunit (family B)
VPNRYFGVLTNGEVKYRGIEARRRDVPFWVKKLQLGVLNCLAKARSLDEVADFLPEVVEIVCQAKRDLRSGYVPLEELVITQSLSRAVEGYSSSSPAARAAMQLQATGREVAPGQFMRFVFVYGGERVRVWELGVDARTVDIKRYCAMLDRAVSGLVGVFEKKETGLGI